MGSDRAAKDLVHRGSQPAAPATDDDHFRIEDLGESPKGMSDISCKLTELHTYAFLVGYGTNPGRQAAIEDRGIPVRLIGVNRPGLHGAVRMFGDNIVASFDIGADEPRVELPGKTDGLP